LLVPEVNNVLHPASFKVGGQVKEGIGLTVIDIEVEDAH
jgi:hypothetical protein